jgi:hypothetical protein
MAARSAFIDSRIIRGAAHERCLTLHAQDLGTAARERQRKIADAAEKIEYPMLRFRLEQFVCLADHGTIDPGVDLHKIDGLEFNADVEFGQRVVKRLLFAAGVQQLQ